MEITKQENFTDKLTPEIFAQLRIIITDDRYSILEAIYKTPNIQHKALCEKLNKKPNNLSNLLRKINSSGFSLIQTSKSGNEKYYSLTPLGMQYIEQKPLPADSYIKDEETLHKNRISSLVEKSIHAKNLFSEKRGIEWRSALCDLLDGKDESEKNISEKDEIQDIYANFSNAIYECRMHNPDELQQIFDALDDSELVEHIRKHLNNKFYYFDAFRPLLAFEKSNRITLFKIIDSIFRELHPWFFSSYECETSRELSLSSDEYNNLLVCITKLSYEFFQKGYSKNDAVSIWKSDYFLTEDISFYIAEKCTFLMLMHKYIYRS